MHETFTTLLRDPAHWEFEIFLMLLFDGLIFGLLFPFALKHWRHHIMHDKRDDREFDQFFGHGLPKVHYEFKMGVVPPSSIRDWRGYDHSSARHEVLTNAGRYIWLDKPREDRSEL